MKHITLLLLAILFAGPSHGETLTLDKALEIALENHYDIKLAREESSRLSGQITEVRSAVLPQLSFEATAGTGYDESFAKLLGTSATQINFHEAKFTATQLLYSWGKAYNAIDGARIEKKRAKIDIIIARRLVKLAVHNGYYDLLLAHRFVAVARQRVEQRQAHLDAAQKRFDAGVSNEFEVIRARVDVANALTPEIEARNLVKIAEASLNNILARPQQSSIEPKGELEYEHLAPPTLDQLTRKALANRPELESLDYSLQSARKLLEINSADNKPTLVALASWGVAAEEVNRLDEDAEVWQAAIKLEIPFFDGLSTSGKVEQSHSTIRSLEIRRRQLEQLITLEARNALDSLEVAQQVFEASTATIGQAKRALEMAQISFDNGLATTLDVTDAEFGLTSALTDQAKAMRDYMSAKAALLATANEL